MNKESKKVSGPAVEAEAGVWRLRLYMCTVAGAGQTLETSASGQGGGETRVMRVSERVDTGHCLMSIRLTHIRAHLDTGSGYKYK